MDTRLISGVLPRDATFGEVGYPPGGRCGPRVQPDVQLVMLHRGSCRIDVGDETRVLKPTMMAVQLPGMRELFRFDPRRPSHHTWIAMRYERVPTGLCGLLADRVSSVLTIPPGFMKVHRAGQDWGRTSRPIAITARSHLAVAALMMVIESAGVRALEDSTADATRPVHPALQAAIQLIEERYAEPLELEDLAEAAHVTPAHLIRLCREALSETPIRRLWRVRTERALELLAASGLSVAEIADRCGFKNPPHLARLVRQQVGRSPREYRAERWSEQPQPVAAGGVRGSE